MFNRICSPKASASIIPTNQPFFIHAWELHRNEVNIICVTRGLLMLPWDFEYTTVQMVRMPDGESYICRCSVGDN